MENIDHKFTDEVVCPYCGEILGDSWELDDDGEIECDECGKVYDYVRNISVSYSSQPRTTKEESPGSVAQQPAIGKGGIPPPYFKYK
jgi:transcription initiation factor TFIIIB Brf1 subunit/transcription initiation factor TFIIB